MRPHRVFILLVFLISPLRLLRAENSRVFIKPPEMSVTEFKAQLLAQRNLIPYDQYMSHRLVPESLQDGLSHAFSAAQESFLRSELPLMEAQWLDVTAYALKADWAKPQRDMIQTAYFRLAQMASTPEKTRQFLEMAIQLDASYTPNPQLFPPPLIDQYEALRTKSQKIQVSTKAWHGFSQILVNGVPHDLENQTEILLSPGLLRVTFLSPSFEPVTRVLDSKILAQFRPQKIAAQMNMPEKIYSPEPAITTPLPASKPQRLFEKPSFWVGAAILAGVALAIERQGRSDRDRANTNSHREGF